MNGKFYSSSLIANSLTTLYELSTSGMEAAIFTVNISNDNDIPVKISFGFLNDDNSVDYYEFEHILGPYETLERTGIISKPFEKLIAIADNDNTYWRVHGYEQSISKLLPDNIRWITESELGQMVGDINFQFVAENADRYELVSGSIPSKTTIDEKGFFTGKNDKSDRNYSFTLKASNSKGVVSYRQFNISMVNRQPIIDNLVVKLPKKMLKKQYVYGYIYGAIDPDGDEITYSIEGLPTGVTVSKSTGLKDYEKFKLETDGSNPAGFIIKFKVISSDGTTGRKEKDVEILIIDDLTFNNFDFIDVNNAERNSEYESNIVKVTGLPTNLWLHIIPKNGTFRYGDSSTLTSTFISYDDVGIDTGDNGEFYLQCKTISSDKFEDTVTVELLLDNINVDWNVTTREADITPNTFTIPPIYDADLKTYYESEIVIVDGLEPNYEIIVMCMTGLINTGIVNADGTTSFTKKYSMSQRIITNDKGQIAIQAKNLSSDRFYDITTMSVIVGLLTADFNITTRKLKDVPTNFKFIDKIDVELNEIIQSDTVIFTGLEPNYEFEFTVISSEGGVNATIPPASLSSIFYNTVKVKTNSNGNVTIAVNLLSDNKFLSKKTMTIQIDANRASSTLSERQTSWSVTTRAFKDLPVGDFDFGFKEQLPLLDTHISPKIVKLSNLEKNYSYTVTCDNGEITGSDNALSDNITNLLVSNSNISTWYKKSITVTTNNDGELWLRSIMKSSNLWDTDVINTVILGKGKGFYRLKTKDDVEPDTFDFIDQLSVNTNTLIVSNIVTLTGLSKNVDITITVSGDNTAKAEASDTIDSTKPFSPSSNQTFTVKTSSTGTLMIRLGVTSSNNFNTSKTVLVKVGLGSADWIVKTRIPKNNISSFNDIIINNSEINTNHTGVFIIDGLEPGIIIAVSSGNTLLKINNKNSDKLTVDANGRATFTGYLTSGKNYGDTVGAFCFTASSTDPNYSLTGDTTGCFTINNRLAVNKPNDVTFTTGTIACESTLKDLESNEITITGSLDTPIAFTVTNGTASVNGKVYTASGNLVLNDKVKLKANVPTKTYGTTSSVTVTFNYGDKTTSWIINRTCPACVTVTKLLPKQPIIGVGIDDLSLRNSIESNTSTILKKGTVKGYYRSFITGKDLITDGTLGKNYLLGSNVWGCGIGGSTNTCDVTAQDIKLLFEDWKMNAHTKNLGQYIKNDVSAGLVTVKSTTDMNDFLAKNYRVRSGTTNIVWNKADTTLTYYVEGELEYDSLDCSGNAPPPPPPPPSTPVPVSGVTLPCGNSQIFVYTFTDGSLQLSHNTTSYNVKSSITTVSYDLSSYPSGNIVFECNLTTSISYFPNRLNVYQGGKLMTTTPYKLTAGIINNATFNYDSTKGTTIILEFLDSMKSADLGKLGYWSFIVKCPVAVTSPPPITPPPPSTPPTTPPTSSSLNCGVPIKLTDFISSSKQIPIVTTSSLADRSYRSCTSLLLSDKLLVQHIEYITIKNTNGKELLRLSNYELNQHYKNVRDLGWRNNIYFDVSKSRTIDSDGNYVNTSIGAPTKDIIVNINFYSWNLPSTTGTITFECGYVCLEEGGGGTE